VTRSAVFDDAKVPRGHLIDDALIEENDAIRDIFFEAITSERRLAALRRDERREPRPSATGRGGALRRGADPRLKTGEYGLDRVDRNALGADRIDRRSEAHEEALEVVAAGLLDFAAFDGDIVDRELLFGR